MGSYGLETIDAATFNNLFVTRLDTPDGLEKAAQAGGAFVRERLREVSFLRGIIPPEYVTKADCQRSVNHDTLVKIVDIEPQSNASVVNFRGKAFERYIGNTSPVYVPKARLAPEEAICLVKRLGGLPVFAHPGVSRLDGRLREFKDVGLGGLEVWHPKHKHADEKHYAKLAKKRGLLAAGGSDFHGPGRSEAALGVPGIGYEVLEALRERHAASVERGTGSARR